jgi:hypothetical protein
LCALTLIAGGRRRPIMAAFGIAILAMTIAVGCGGGGAAGVPAGTPAGAYQIIVTGTSGSLTHTTTLTLQVN